MTTYELFSIKSDVNNINNYEIKHLETLPDGVDHTSASLFGSYVAKNKEYIDLAKEGAFLITCEYKDGNYIDICNFINPPGKWESLPDGTPFYNSPARLIGNSNEERFKYVNSRVPRSIVKNND